MAHAKGEGRKPHPDVVAAQKNVAISNADSSKPQSQKTQAASNSWRDVLPIHPAADMFPLMSEAELRELGEDIRNYGMLTPIVVWAEAVNLKVPTKHSQFSLLDGRNRLDAMELVGIPVELSFNNKSENWMLETAEGSFSVKLEVGVDPYESVISANIHRRHLTAEQKRELIAKLLAAKPDQSDRQTAKLAKVDHKTVATVRKEQEARGEIPHVEARTDTKGRKQPARKKPARREDQKIRDQNDRSFFILNCDTAVSVANYEGPIDEQILRSCRNVVKTWGALLKQLEASADCPSSPSKPPPDDDFPDLPECLRRQTEGGCVMTARPLSLQDWLRANPPPDLKDLVRRYGGYDKIPPAGWTEWDQRVAEWHIRRQHIFAPPNETESAP